MLLRPDVLRAGLACLAAAATLLLATAIAHAQARVALVIGNGAYRSVGELGNPPNDAGDVAAALGRLGFAVSRVSDGSLETMRRALAELRERGRKAEMSVVFFAGHGIEAAGENWLLPVDARLGAGGGIDSEAVSLTSVLASIEGASKLGLVILDACRDDPLGSATARPSKGLARIDPKGDVLIAYAAKDGSTAADGAGRNSPFTGALLAHLETPGLEINFLFRRVRDDVLLATGRAQFPYVYGSLSQEEIFLRPASAPSRPSRQVATDYPTRPVTLVVAFAGGGPTDTMARLVAERLTKALGQPVVVENKLGGNGVDGTVAVARAAPDGYTLLLGDTVTHGINPSLLRATGYDPRNDFEPVGLIGGAHLALVVAPKLEAASGAELIALLRDNPHMATYASAGAGTLSHLAAEHFASSIGVKLAHLPFPGEGPAMFALLGGHATLHFSAFQAAAGQANRGSAKIVALTGTRRSSLFPGVGTLAEAGLGGFEAVRNYGVLAPAGTPRAAIERINEALRAALSDPAVRARLAQFGVEPAAATPDGYAKLIDREIAKWTRIMWRAGIDQRR